MKRKDKAALLPYNIGDRMSENHYDIPEELLDELIMRERIHALLPEDKDNFDKLQLIVKKIMARKIKAVIPYP